MKLRVNLLFKSGVERSLEIEWEIDAGMPEGSVIINLGAVGLVSSSGAFVKWDPTSIDLIEVDGPFNEMVEGEERAPSIDDLSIEPEEVQCEACQAEMWLDVLRTKQGLIRAGECPRCGCKVSRKLEPDDRNM